MQNYQVEINIKSSNKRLANALKNYYFYHIDEFNNVNKNQQIIQRIKESNIVIINKFLDKENNDMFAIIGFNKTIICVQDSSIDLLQYLFSNNTQLKFCFLQNTKDIFAISNNQISQYSKSLDEEIDSFNIYIKISRPCKDQIFNMRKSIESVISAYLIEESYFKLIEEQRNNLYSSQKNPEESKIKEWTEDDYIILRSLGAGSAFKVELIYEIETEHLFAIKKPNSDENEILKLNPREYDNYLEINYPLIPKFYGKQKIDNYLIIQYIHGQTLDTIDLITLTKEDRIIIFFEIVLIINYIHDKNFVYRDLKPDNIIIDDNKTAFLIDFDRMIKINLKREFDNCTIDFGSQFVAPEVNNREVTYNNDIYSIGQIMKYLHLEKVNDKIYSLYQKMTNYQTNERPNIYTIMHTFYSFFYQHINETIIRNFPEIQYLLGLFYYEGEYIKQNINKSIFYFTLAANQNYPRAQFKLGLIYHDGEYIKQDINKSIYYFTLAANQNHSRAQYNLGLIYSEDEYNKLDINKSIHFFNLAANQNYPRAHFNLGLIYYEGKYIKQDINKSIYYLSLASNQNYPEAQFKLGLIYHDGEYIKQDINKSIYYFTLAANQNHSGAQYDLGLIFYEGEYIKQDINKSIHYFTLAANQYHLRAQFILGLIFYEGEYIKQDINKSIYYFTLAANQNHPRAQFNLGLIYYENEYIKSDINKSIYYFTLAANQNDQDAQFNLGIIYYTGKYIKRDINKSIYYFTLAANQDNPRAQFNIGLIYYEGEYINRDIIKSIYYFTLAANQNDQDAQYNLGLIYYDGRYIKRDINKSIHYFTLAANQNDQDSQYNLGLIFYINEYVQQNIKKSIHYFSLAANQNHPIAQFNLGLIYYDGKYIKQDINRSIYYLSLAANQNQPNAQFMLGHFYSKGIYYRKNMIKSIDYFLQASSKGHIGSHFAVGYFFHEGKHIKRDIKKAIHHYKEASTFNNQYAKNNLGVIYRFGCGEEIPPNCGLSIAYFEEAIQRFSDKVSMYNLAHIYIFDDKNKSRLKKSIELLIRSTKLDFFPSTEILCIALIKLFGFDIEKIIKELQKLIESSSILPKLISEIIIYRGLLNEPFYESYYQSYSKINYLYNFEWLITSTKALNEPKPVSTVIISGRNITREFYDGFGNDLLNIV